MTWTVTSKSVLVLFCTRDTSPLNIYSTAIEVLFFKLVTVLVDLLLVVVLGLLLSEVYYTKTSLLIIIIIYVVRCMSLTEQTTLSLYMIANNVGGTFIKNDFIKFPGPNANFIFSST